MSIRRPIPIRGLLTFCAGAILLLAASVAHADEGPSTSFGLGAIKVPGDEKAKTGKGLSFGRSIFHAGLSLEGGWDSNVAYDSANDPTGPVSSAYLRLLPQLTLGSRPVEAGQKQGFTYNLALALDYVGYLQELTPASMGKHHVGASLGADLKFNPEGLVSFALVEQFVRTNEPRAGQDTGSIDRDYNSVGFDLTFTKGLLSFLVGYRFKIDIFEQSTYKFANRMIHEAKFKTTWRFFPQTSFWFMATTGYVDYFQDFSGTPGDPAAGNRSSIPLRLMVGVTGRFTRWLTADVGIGYGLAVYGDDPPDLYHHDVIASLAVGFDMGPTAKLRFGYRHDFTDSLVGDFYKSDTAYVRFNLALFQRLILELVTAYTRADYQRYYLLGASGSSCDANNQCNRVDNYLWINVGADYYFLSWLSAGIGYALMANITDFSADYLGIPIHPDFLKHRVYGRVTAYY